MRKAPLTSATIALGLTLFCGTGSASAEEFGGIEFPDGEDSFAESVIKYELGDNTNVGDGWNDPDKALGPPDYDPSTETGAVSLGNAQDDGVEGELIVAFDSNRLINIEGDDLYIFETGTDAEKTLIDISIDSENWVELGMIEGDTRAIDLATVPEIPENAAYRYVRIRDFPNGDTTGSPYGGPDIDAVGAIGSIDASLVENGRIIDDSPNGGDSGCACTSVGGTTDGTGFFAVALLLGTALLRRRND